MQPKKKAKSPSCGDAEQQQEAATDQAA